MNDLNTDRETRREERRAKSAEIRAEAMDDVARRAERHFEDTRLDGLRARGPRRALIAAWLALVLGIAGATLVDDPLLTIASFAVGGAATWFLRRLVRAVPDLPDEVLDERLIRQRDHAYRLAYQAVVAVTMLVLIGMYIAADGTRPDYDIQPAHVNALFMLVLFGALGLPSAIFGWTEQEL